MKKDYSKYVKHKYHCGPGHWPHWLKWLLGVTGRNKFCAWHDTVYREDEDRSYEQQQKRDLEWLKGMLDDHQGNIISSYIDFTFYLIVYHYGKKSWDNNTQEHHKKN